jgi:archaellum component FlaF (FlaF/FlaG flagellin family)
METQLRTSFLVFALTTAAARAQDCTFEYVHVTPSGALAVGTVNVFMVSGNGRYVAFDSSSPDLVPGDTNGERDVFVRDLLLKKTERVSLDGAGLQLSEISFDPSISADGRWVAFTTVAGIDPMDQDGRPDVYLRDRLTGATEWVSVPWFPGGKTLYSREASVSADGRYVAFASHGPDLVPGDSNEHYDVFVRDRELSTTTRVSVSSAGAQGEASSWSPAISANGRRVAFVSRAQRLGYSWRDPFDIHAFVHDLDAGTTELVDGTPDGEPGDSWVGTGIAISPDGRTVAFHSSATDLMQSGASGSAAFSGLYVRRLPAPVASVPFANSPFSAIAWIEGISLSWDGRYLSFDSHGYYWVAGYPVHGQDAYLHDLQAGVTSVVSTVSTTQLPNGPSEFSSVSWDGSVIAFQTSATNLVPGYDAHTSNKLVVRVCDTTAGLDYCYPTSSPAGCLPALSVGGTSSASASAGHAFDVSDAVNGQVGLFLYGTSGSTAVPWSDGHLCVLPPIRRMPAAATGGSAPPTVDCTGTLAVDFNAWIASGADAGLSAGTPVYLQAWLRDPTHPLGALFSDARAFVIGP